STSIKVGTTTTAATSHGFAAAEALGGERAASVICRDQPCSGMNQRLARKAYRLGDTSRHRGPEAACLNRRKEQTGGRWIRYSGWGRILRDQSGPAAAAPP